MVTAVLWKNKYKNYGGREAIVTSEQINDMIQMSFGYKQ